MKCLFIFNRKKITIVLYIKKRSRPALHYVDSHNFRSIARIRFCVEQYRRKRHNKNNYKKYTYPYTFASNKQVTHANAAKQYWPNTTDCSI